MSEMISGIIQELETRQVSGGRTAYNIRVGGESYGCGLYPPKSFGKLVTTGDYVTFEVDRSRGYPNVAAKTLKVGKAPPGAAEEAAASPAPSKASPKPAGGWDNRQDVISRQAAMNTALQFMAQLAAQDALPITKSKSKANTEEAMLAILRRYTAEFYEYNTGTEFKDISPNPSDLSDSEGGDDTPADDEWEE